MIARFENEPKDNSNVRKEKKKMLFVIFIMLGLSIADWFISATC